MSFGQWKRYSNMKERKGNHDVIILWRDVQPPPPRVGQTLLWRHIFFYLFVLLDIYILIFLSTELADSDCDGAQTGPDGKSSSVENFTERNEITTFGLRCRVSYHQTKKV